MENVKRFFPIVWYYVGWFGCIYLGKFELSPWSFVFPLFLTGLLFYWKKIEVKLLGLLLAMAFLGVIFDSFMAIKGYVVFAQPESFFIPQWLLAIWWLFILLIPVMVSVFFQRLWLAALLGAIFGPLSYASGAAMQVLYLQGSEATGFYAAFWGLYFPVVIFVAGRFFPALVSIKND